MYIYMQYYYNTILCAWQRTQDDRFLRLFLFYIHSFNVYTRCFLKVYCKNRHIVKERSLKFLIFFFFFDSKKIKNVIDINVYSQ